MTSSEKRPQQQPVSDIRDIRDIRRSQLVILLTRARELGLHIAVHDGNVIVRGPSTEETRQVVEMIAERKPEVLQLVHLYRSLDKPLLRDEAAEIRRLAETFGIELHWRRFYLDETAAAQTMHEHESSGRLGSC